MYFVERTLPAALSVEEERSLVEAMRCGCENSRQTLLEHNTRLAVKKAMQFRNSGIEAEELISLAMLGMTQTIAGYDPGRGTKLSTYICMAIENTIIKEMRWNAAKKRTAEVLSLDRKVQEDSNKTMMAFYPVRDDVETLHEILDAEEDMQLMLRAIRKLSSKEQAVLCALYGLDGCERCTQMETAKLVGVSQSSVSRIEKRALQKLRYMIRKEELSA